MLQSWVAYSETDFHAEEYRTKITKVKFATNVKIPNSKIESWDVSEAKDKSVMAWIEDDGSDEYILTIAGKNKIIANTNSSCLFFRFSNLKIIENIELFDTSNVTNMNSIFQRCSSLTKLDLSTFDTSKVIFMNGMFSDCNNLKELNLNNFNTTNVNDMSNMFRGCNSLTSLDLSSFNTPNLATVGAMFENCNNMVELNLSNFDTSKVYHFFGMFRGCSNLISINRELNINFENNNTYFGVNEMFKDCNNLTADLYIIENSLNSNRSNYESMFLNCAINPPAKIVLNYKNINTLNDEVNLIISTKSENSNVIIGVQK